LAAGLSFVGFFVVVVVPVVDVGGAAEEVGGGEDVFDDPHAVSAALTPGPQLRPRGGSVSGRRRDLGIEQWLTRLNMIHGFVPFPCRSKGGMPECDSAVVVSRS
jgi:hypothetical protein